MTNLPSVAPSRTRSATIALAMVLAVEACAGGDGSGGGTNAKGPSTSDAGVSGGSHDASEDALASTDAKSLDYGYRENTGSVAFVHRIGEVSANLTASFIKSRRNDPRERRIMENCLVVIDSREVDAGFEDGEVERALPGTVTATAGSPSYALTFTGAENTLGTQRSVAPGQFSGGEDVHFTSTGAEVPPFDVHLALPLVLHLTRPAEVTGSLPLPRDRDLQLTWERGKAGLDLYFDASTVRALDGRKTLTSTTCRFESSRGRGVLPRSVLSLFEKGDTGRLFSVAYQRARVGVFETEFLVATTVHFPPPDSRVAGFTFE